MIKELYGGPQTTGQPTVKQFLRSSYSFWFLESRGESVADPIVDKQQLLACKGHRSDAHDRDQRGNQAIFDGGDARFVFEKTSDNVFHA
jgi:hypothetical protein